jgi:Trk K+ transport system NAD-binding subunit
MSLVSRIFIKFKIILLQNILSISIIIIWFSVNFLIFYLLKSDLSSALRILFYFREPDTSYELFYANFTEFIIFGLVIASVTTELFKKYHHEDTCRKLAKSFSNHIVIIGYNHIGKRITDFLKDLGEDVVVVEKRSEVLQDLIDKEEPVILADALIGSTLIDAGVDKAKAVLIMSDNLEVQLVLNANVRQLNRKCALVCRVFQDDIGDLIAKTYNAKIISTSKFASEVIFEKITRHNYKNVLLIGLNHITARLMARLNNLPHVTYHLIEENEETIEDYSVDPDKIFIGDPKDGDLLKKVEIERVEYVFNAISDIPENILVIKRVREFNKTCKILARFFNDDVAEILEKPPFSVKVISSSKYTLHLMEKRGFLDFK